MRAGITFAKIDDVLEDVVKFGSQNYYNNKPLPLGGMAAKWMVIFIGVYVHLDYSHGAVSCTLYADHMDSIVYFVTFTLIHSFAQLI